jgi:signal transduction histidine kinase/PAS domain-containing protein
MPSVRASVLIVGHPDPKSVGFGADFAPDFAAAKKAVGEFNYPVVVFPGSAGAAGDAVDFLKHLNGVSPLSQRVVIQNHISDESLLRIINLGSLFRILSGYDDERFETTIHEALEEFRLLRQNAKLLQLVNEQHDRLKRLTTELEERVEVRRKSLEDAKEKLLTTNHRVEALHRALVAIHRAGSIGEMERLVNEALSGALGLAWTRILFHSQTGFDNSSLGSANFAIQRVPLVSGKETLGHVVFARGASAAFSRDETAFLNQIADAVSLAIDRLTKLEESETLKAQWEATFDAILEPVSLIDENHNVVRANRAFAQEAGRSFVASPNSPSSGSANETDKIIGKKCYQMLFARETPCDGCKAGSSFRLKPARTCAGTSTIYEVFTQSIQFSHEERPLYVNMYHDVSERIRYERQILESAKMAELGTIGSSIAHELNNPLGGMLSFLQLIKMDLKGAEPWYEDIDEMEKGARRCRDIVQSLLGFTRKSRNDIVELIDLNETIEQALKITELQTRAMGITVTRDFSSGTERADGHGEFEIRGQFNFIAQALRNFFQNAQDAIADRSRGDKSFRGEIRVRLFKAGDERVIEITDNGTGFDTTIGEHLYDAMYTTKDPINNPGLGLTVAQKIVIDHGGRLELSSAKGVGTTAKISFPRPVFEG